MTNCTTILKLKVSALFLYIMAAGLRKDSYELKGWFKLDTESLASNVKLSCYICNILRSREELSYSRTIPIHQIPANIRDTSVFSNQFVICVDCVSNKKFVQAPKTYEMVIEHRIKSENSLSAEKDELQQKERALKLEIAELKQACSLLERNKELEVIRFKKLREYKDLSGIEIDQITARTSDFRTIMRKMVRDAKQEIEDIHGDIDSKLNGILDHIKIENRFLTDMAAIETTSNYHCNICCMREIKIAFAPCGHLICTECFEKIVEVGEHLCPFCKTEIKKRLRVFV